jgi:transcriptional regulator with XRE-family HTH domain
MNQEKLGLLIRKKRVEKGLTQEQLASHLGVSPKTISRWERSLNIPDVSMLESLSLELGISVKDLIVGEETVVQDIDPSILTILYMQKEEIFKITKKKKNRFDMSHDFSDSFFGYFIWLFLNKPFVADQRRNIFPKRNCLHTYFWNRYYFKLSGTFTHSNVLSVSFNISC